MRIPGRRQPIDDPTEVWGDDARAGGRDLELPEDYWADRAREEEIAADARTRRAPLLLTGITGCVGAATWGTGAIAEAVGGAGAGSAVTVAVCAGTALTVPVARALLRDRIAEAGERTDDDPDRWVRRWWIGSACAACWVDAVTAAGIDMTGTGAIAAGAVLAVGSWLLGAAWWAAHEVPDPGEVDDDEPADDGQPAAVSAVAVRVPEIEEAVTEAETIELDWAEYVAAGENAVAGGSRLLERTRLPHGWRWTVYLDRRGSINCSGLVVAGVDARVAHKLELDANHVMLERLPEGGEHRAQLTIVTRDVLADGVPYTGPNYRDGIIRIGRYADGSGQAEWIAYNPTGVQPGLITGDPRSGKSAFLAKLGGDLKSSGEWVLLVGDGDPAGMSAPVLAEVADDLARGNDEILEQLEALEAIQEHVRGDLMGTLTIGPDGKPVLMTMPDRQAPADKMLPCPQYPGIAWLLDEFHRPAAALRSVNFANRVEKVVRGLAKYGLMVIISTQSKIGADFGGSSDLRAMLAKNEISFRAENKAGIGAVGDGSTDPSTLPRGGGYAFLGHGERHAMVRTEFTLDPQTGGSNMYRWVPQIKAAGVPMDELTAQVYRRYRPVRVLDREADHADRTARLAAVRAALEADAPLPGSPEARAAEKAAGDGEASEGEAREPLAGLPSLSSVVLPFQRRHTEPAPAVPDESALSKNARTVLDDVRTHPGPQKSADIIARTGLTDSAVSRALAELRRHGLVHRPSGVRGVHEAGPGQINNEEAV